MIARKKNKEANEPVLSVLRAAVFAAIAPFPDLSVQPVWAADEIIVTAAKRTEPLQDIPASVSVIGGDAIAIAIALNSAEEIAQLTSGLQAAVANGAQVSFQVRGIGAVDHQALTPTAAAVYVDGVFLATNVQTGPLLYDLERIEILKGPQGSLYGRNASSGAINFITARPGRGTSGYVSASYGRFDRVDLTGAANLDLSDGVRGRLAGRYLTQGPTLDNVQRNPGIAAGPSRAGGERDEWGLRGSLVFESGSDTEVLFRVHYEEDNGVNAAPRNSSLTLNDHEISVGADGVQDTDNEFYGASVEIASTLGAWDLYSLSAFEGYNQQYGFDFDGTPAPFGDASLNGNLHYDRGFWQVSEELRVARAWGFGQTMIGLAAAHEVFDQDYLIWCGELDPETLLGTCRYVGAPGRVGPAPASPGVATSLLTEIEQTRTTAAIFTYNDVALSENLTLTIGGRYTYEDIDGEGRGRHIFDDGVVGFNNRDGLGEARGANEIEESRLSGNVALSYAFSENAMAYASFSNGYKSGGFNGEVQNNAAHFDDEGLFAAETVNAFELGAKGRPVPALRLSGALFYQDYQNPQARIFVNFPLPDGTPITSNSLSNLDEARVFGLEGEAAWSPVAGLDINASLTLLETEIRQTSDVGGNAATFDGNPLPFAPDVSAALFARYEWSVAPDVRLSLQGNAKVQSAIFLDAEGLAERRQPAYGTIDAEASVIFDRSGVALSLWGRNLSDVEYAVSGFGFIGYNVFLGDPRTYGVRVRKTF